MKKAGGYHYRVVGGILWNWHHDKGFLMHQACWELLDTLCGVSYRRVLGVFTSIPTYDARVPSWGHEYSLKPVRKYYYPQYPWRTCDIYGQKSRPDPLAANPRLAAREFASLLATSPIPPEEAGEWDTVFESADQSCDAFFRLPAEIRLEIGLLLGFDDVVALRLASKAFSFLFHDQQFWASQFLAPHGTRRWLLGNEYEYLLLAEREWMLEAKDLIPHMIRAASKNGTDWRWLFRQTGKRRSATNNLGRIWGLAKQLKVILDLEFPRNDAPTFPYGQQAHDQPISAPCTPYSTRQRLSQIEWQYQPWVGELEDTGPQFQSTRLVFLPDDLSRLSFSFVPLGGERYLAGIVFHARRTEEDFWLGYHNTAEPLETVEINRDFCGFELAVGSRGIQGISCVDGEGRAIGDWVGLDPRHAHKLPVTSRLSCRARTKILAVRAHFDVSFKIRKRGLEHVPRGERKDLSPLLTTFEQGLRFILLSVASEHTVRIFEEKPYEFDEGAFTMRRNGVWYPGLPTDNQGEDQYLHIWDEHALHAGRLCQGYKPLTWICFGGWGGSALSHITNMSVLLHGKFSPRQFTIKFSYDSAYNAQDDSWRERHAMLSTRATAHPELEEAFEDFPIDGARGEFIVNVGMLMHFSEVYVHSAHRRRDFEANGFPVGINVSVRRPIVSVPFHLRLADSPNPRTGEDKSGKIQGLHCQE